METGRVLCTLAGHTNGVDGVALSADGRLVVSASHDHTLKLWELETARELRTLVGHKLGVNGVALSSDGRLAVSASGDDTLKVWEVPTGAVIATFACDAAADCCAFINNEKIIAGDAGGHLHFLRLEKPIQ